MGTTLTGTTPQDTYDSLIKVTDNGPISGTAKYLSDGLGNDSVLALSTTAVGINTSSPAVNLHISGNASGRASLRLASTAANRLAAISFYGNNVESAIIGYEGGSEIVSGGVQGDLIIRNVLSGKDIILDTNAGNVGIGTLAPSRLLTLKNNAGATNGISFQSLATTAEIAAIECNQTLDTIDIEMLSNFAGNGVRFLTGTPTLVERARFTANGLTFNGDTAAANALDDYEEGTWTPTDQSGAGLTFATASGNYTKIGREVFYRAVITYPSTASISLAEVGGLPFTVPNNNQSRGGFVTYSTLSALAYAITVLNTTKVGLTDNTGTSLTNVQLTGATIFIGGSYNV
jgi:hypothetical protein